MLILYKWAAEQFMKLTYNQSEDKARIILSNTS